MSDSLLRDYVLLSSDVSLGNKPSCTKYRIFLTVLLVINTITFALITGWTHKFVKVFRLKKKMQLIFLVLVCLSALGRIFFFGIELAYRKGTCIEPPPICIEGTIHWLNAAMLTSAIISNIFNWLYQTLRLEKMETGSKKDQRGYHIALIVSLVFELIVYLSLTLLACTINNLDKTVFIVFGGIYSSTFLIVGAVFAIAGIIFYTKFKRISPENAKRIKLRVIISIFIIFTSFLIRGATNLIVVILEGDETMRLQWLEKESIGVAIGLSIYFIVVDIIPSVYLSYSIKVITDDYRHRYLSQSSKIGNSYNNRLSFGEQSINDNNYEQSRSYETSSETLARSRKQINEERGNLSVNDVIYFQ
ncbi:unnamed protein product [Moneuplotes crassus]|uniref:THH1/TOM1/TOM3 domain-containing protein n=1 Tax=Euplotes crassus TaxID=5936 RepID=A0AAD1XBZ9_EUPCR|nr:unnamed protein product [Moneuplotes crassus]